MIREKILNEAKEIIPYAIKLREEFHRNPELSFQEYDTSLMIERELKAEKIPYNRVGTTGIVAAIQGYEPEKAGTVALRTDMDALPIKEETEESFRSCNANMHACGHDMHMAMVLAAGKILNNRKEYLRGNVKLIFQPAEEIGQGAETIIHSGRIQDVDTILALHMDPQEKVGVFHTGYGVRTSSGCCVEIDLKGHRDALFPATAMIINLLSEWVPKLLKTEYPYAFSPTIVQSIEEDHLQLFYDGRIFSSKDRQQLEEITENIVFTAMRLYPVTVSIQTERIGGAVRNHRESVDRAIHVVSELFGQESVKITAPSMFGEDFRCYDKVTDKLVFTMLGGACDTMEYSLHSCKVKFSNDAMLYGIAYYLGYIAEYFKI